jgi:hypothetical protein
VISGAGYSVVTQDGVVEPISYGDLQLKVQSMSVHTAALGRIRTATNVNAVSDVTSMRELSTILGTVAMDELTKQQVIKDAKSLSFPNRFWSTAPENVKRALVLLTNDTEIGYDVPLHPDFLFTVDRVETVMAAFGHEAFTFMLPNGKETKLSGGPPQNLATYTVAIASAIADMKYMMENGSITNNLTNLSNKHRGQSYNSSLKKEVWDLLKLCGNADENDGTATHVVPGGNVGGALGDDLW